MHEPQRLSIERDLATARRALHRALETAERGAFYAYEDAIHKVNNDLGAIMESVIKKHEHVTFSLDHRA